MLPCCVLSLVLSIHILKILCSTRKDVIKKNLIFFPFCDMDAHFFRSKRIRDFVPLLPMTCLWLLANRFMCHIFISASLFQL